MTVTSRTKKKLFIVFQVFIFGCVCEWTSFYNEYFYIFIWVINGFMQSTGWPLVVACMGNWFGKSRFVVTLHLQYVQPNFFFFFFLSLLGKVCIKIIGLYVLSVGFFFFLNSCKDLPS